MVLSAVTSSTRQVPLRMNSCSSVSCLIFLRAERTSVPLGLNVDDLGFDPGVHRIGAVDLAGAVERALAADLEVGGGFAHWVKPLIVSFFRLSCTNWSSLAWSSAFLSKLLSPLAGVIALFADDDGDQVMLFERLGSRGGHGEKAGRFVLGLLGGSCVGFIPQVQHRIAGARDDGVGRAPRSAGPAAPTPPNAKPNAIGGRIIRRWRRGWADSAARPAAAPQSRRAETAGGGYQRTYIVFETSNNSLAKNLWR